MGSCMQGKTDRKLTTQIVPSATVHNFGEYFDVRNYGQSAHLEQMSA